MRTLLHHTLLASMLATALSAPAWAQETDPAAAASAAEAMAAEAAAMDAAAVMDAPPASAPEPGMADAAPATDQRIRQLVYNAGDVYTITTKYGYQTNIVFSPKENIETISVGDKSVWQIIPSGQRIFIRPMEEGSITNMTVLTNRRSYQFDLKSLGPADTEGNIYVASFIYPEEIIAAAQAAAAKKAAKQAQEQAATAMFGGAMMVDANGNPLPPGPPPGAMPPPPPPPPPPGFMPAPPPGAMPPMAHAAPPPVPPANTALPPNVPFGGPTPPPVESAVNVAPPPAPVGSYGELPPPPPFGGPAPMPAPPPVQAAAPAPMPIPTMAPAAVVVPPGNANFNYTYSGVDALAPLQVFDDGQFTYLKYANINQRPLPDAYVLDASGRVAVAPHQLRGEYMVVEAVVPEMILKNSYGSVHVYNESLAPPR